MDTNEIIKLFQRKYLRENYNVQYFEDRIINFQIQVFNYYVMITHIRKKSNNPKRIALLMVSAREHLEFW